MLPSACRVCSVWLEGVRWLWGSGRPQVLPWGAARKEARTEVKIYPHEDS